MNKKVIHAIFDDEEILLQSVKEIKSKKVGKSGPQHRIIESDNLIGLEYLKKQKESFDVIYIDPPYNTGNKDFKYNDHYVDEDDEFRHSKWISFCKVGALQYTTATKYIQYNRKL